MKLIFIISLIGILQSDESLCMISNEKEWYTLLPKCPCNNPDAGGIKLKDGWAKDKGNIEKYHSGSTECFRSYPTTITVEGKSGQQCCYDKKGKLITSGSGAGTPDKVSTCRGEDNEGVMKTRFLGLLGHYFKDVNPWLKAGDKKNAWKVYNKNWPPNTGNNCE